jgi:hypothetical protein
MFRLNIECTKDIDRLVIDFTDGTSSVVESKPKPQKVNQPKASTPKVPREQLLDVDADYSSIQQEVVEKPVIESKQRPVKVAEELQNFDF